MRNYRDIQIQLGTMRAPFETIWNPTEGMQAELGPTATLLPSWNICVSMGALGELQMRYTHQVCSLHTNTTEDGAPSGCDCFNGCSQKAPNERYTHQVRRGWEPPSGHGWVNGCPPELSNERNSPSPQSAHKNNQVLEPTVG